MRRLRVGVIGCGAIAQIMHLPHLRELDERFALVALCDAAPETLAAVGDFCGVAARFTDYRALLVQDLDAVLVLTAGSHAEATLAALRAGKYVFVEKPLAYTVREADAVVAAAAETGLTVMVGYMKRYDPAYRHARELVRRLDRLRFVRVTILHPADEAYWSHIRIRRRPGAPRPTVPPTLDELKAALRAAVSAGPEAALIEEALGGASAASVAQRITYLQLIGSLVHQVNALRGILGEPEGVGPTEIWNDGLCFTAALRFPADVRATLQWLYLPEYKRYQEEYGFLADAARVWLQFPSPYLRNEPTLVLGEGMEGGVAWERRDLISYEEAFALELVHFHECVTEGRRPETPAEDGRADLALLRAMALAWHGSA